MIVLFEENETKFTSLGLGVLSDPISCIVTEGLNDNFELQLVYPVTGVNYSKIKINRLLFIKPNPYEEAQPFRIISITKPINGKITVDAVHISYDTNGIIVKPIKAGNLSDAVEKIQNGDILKTINGAAILDHDFKIYTDMTGTKTFATTNYYNLRALLMGSDSSLMNVYNCELSFDKFKIYLNKQRGTYRGAQVRYAKNMKDLNHVISYEKLYNGVYPFYHQETTETTTNTTSDGFKQVYIVGSKPFQDGWLSYTVGGEPYHPVDESPVQIGSDGDYKDKVYCWNTNLQRYQQKKYNEMVTVIEGVLSPEWIFIDWSALPTLTCKAKVDGYFKLMTEENWTFHKAGEIVFQGSFKNIAESLIIYYSEVVPNESTSEVTETESVTHVELDDKIIWLDTDGAKDMKHNRILSLDLTSEFDDVPDKDALELKAKEYIEKNKIGKYKYETRVSFVDLSKTKEGVQYEGFEKILLGDIVKVVYEDMGVDVELRVTSVKYDALKDAYDSVDLGEKPEKMSSSSVQNGDDISALTNDVGYADITTVNKLVAKIVTADFIKAKDAELSKAQIEMLETARIKCSGIIEASQFELDTLIAKLLIADNAQIKETLEAGTIKVNGDITISKGSINIKDDEKGTVFNVDREGNVRANSVSITGGAFNINDGVFEVERDGTMHATGAIISGQIDAQSGSIAGFNIVEDALYNGIASFDENSYSSGVYIGPDGIRLGSAFKVDASGNLKATSAEITGKITATEGYIGSFEITSSGLIFKDNNEKAIVNIDPYNLSYGLKPKENPDDTDEYYFNVSNQGSLTAEKGFIAGFSFDSNKLYSTNVEISSDKLKYGDNFEVDNYGNLKMSSAKITGTDNFAYNTLELRSIKVEEESTYEGEYSNQSTYNIGDFVKIQLFYYECIVSITEPEEFDSNKWKLIDPSRAYIAYGKSKYSSNSQGIYLGTDGIKLGSNFSVDINGNLRANNVTVSGTIKAEAGNGYLGGSLGFTIGSKAIYNGLDTMDPQTTTPGIYLGTDGIRLIGKSFSGHNYEFKVDEYGHLKAENAELTGSIIATTGSIGGFNFNENRLYSTNIEISPDKLKYGYNFEVSSSGTLTALSGTIAGFSFDGNKLYSTDVEISSSGLKYGSHFSVDSEGNLSVIDAAIFTDMITLKGSEVTVSNTGVSSVSITDCYVSGFSYTSDIVRTITVTVNLNQALSAGTTIPIMIRLTGSSTWTHSTKIGVPSGQTSFSRSFSIAAYGSTGASVVQYPKTVTAFTTKGTLTVDSYPVLVHESNSLYSSKQIKFGYRYINSFSHPTIDGSTKSWYRGEINLKSVAGLTYLIAAVAMYINSKDTYNGRYENFEYTVDNTNCIVYAKMDYNDGGSVSVFYIGY